MSQIAGPVIAGLEVVEHFGEAREVLARLMAAPVVRDALAAVAAADALGAGAVPGAL